MPRYISPSASSYRPHRPARRRTLIATAVALALAGAGVGAWTFLAPGPGVHGLADGAYLDGRKAAQVSAYLDAGAAGSKEKVRATLDGAVIPVTAEGARLKLALPRLTEGRHTLVVEGDSKLPLASYRKVVAFTVDTSAPDLKVADPEIKNTADPVTITGKASTDAKVTADGKEVPIDKGGAFKITVPKGTPSVTVTAVDRAGNTTSKAVSTRGRRPMIRAAHITAIGWGNDTLRGGVLALVRSGKLNAVQLDVKDEDGEVGYASQVPLARQIGAAKGYYDARKAIAEIHAAGAQVIGRIVAFRDPKLGAAAWKAGKRNQVVQTPSGEAYNGGHYGNLSFTNFADPTVRKYNQDLAVEAAKLGFDDILYDYVRRPDGPLSKMRFPGIGSATPSRPSPRSSPTPGSRCARTPSTSASRSSALPPPGLLRSPRTSGPWSRSATTSRRWSTRPTGVPGSTASPTPTPPRTRSCSARSPTSPAWRRAPRPRSSRGSRTSRWAASTGRPRWPNRSRPRRPTR